MYLKTIYIVFCLFVLNSFQVKAGSIIGLDDTTSNRSYYSLDTQFQSILSLHPMIKPSMVSEKGLPKTRISENKSGFFFLAIILLFIFSLARLIFPKYFSNLFQIFTSLNISKRHIKDQLENDNRASIWFYLIFFLSVGYIVYLLIIRNTMLYLTNFWYLNYALCTLFVIVLFGLRIGIIRIIGWIFDQGEMVQTYLFNNKLVNEFLGLMLFPLCILMMIAGKNLQSTLLVIASILFLLMFIYSYLRNIPVLRNLFRISFIHFLLYLCALEVIPILILIKLVR
jgi:hypothetical protein